MQHTKCRRCNPRRTDTTTSCLVRKNQIWKCLVRYHQVHPRVRRVHRRVHRRVRRIFANLGDFSIQCVARVQISNCPTSKSSHGWASWDLRWLSDLQKPSLHPAMAPPASGIFYIFKGPLSASLSPQTCEEIENWIWKQKDKPRQALFCTCRNGWRLNVKKWALGSPESFLSSNHIFGMNIESDAIKMKTSGNPLFTFSKERSSSKFIC